MKRNVYHAIIALGIVSVGFLFWYMMAPAGSDALTVEELRHMLHEGLSPEERALGAAGLGERRDVASMPALLDAMQADSALVRGNAGVAVRKILGVDLNFDPEGSPDERKATVDYYRILWEAWRRKNNASGEAPPAELNDSGGGS